MSKLRERMSAIVAEQTALITAPDDAGDDWEMSAESAARFDELQAEIDGTDDAPGLRARIEDDERRRAAITSSAAIAERGDDGATFNVNTRDAADPFEVSDITLFTPQSDIRGRAATAIERVEGNVPDHVREQVTQSLERIEGGVGNAVAHRVLGTGSKAYRSAFSKVMSGRNWALTPDESQAFERAQAIGANADGGFAIPFTLDPTLILQNDGRINPVRGLASTKQTVTNQWNGVTTAGAVASWDGEAVEVSDDSITLDRITIDCHKLQVFVPYSSEVEQDWPGMESDLRTVMMDAKDEAEATAHITGTGTGQPQGIEVGLDGTASDITSGAVGVISGADINTLMNAVPPRYRNTADQAAWLGTLAAANVIRGFDTSGGAQFWVAQGNGTPERLRGWRWFESSKVDAPSATGESPLIVGDIAAGYYIVNRIGMQVENIPHLFGNNNRPTGQRGILAYLRTGARVVNAGAMRMLTLQ